MTTIALVALGSNQPKDEFSPAETLRAAIRRVGDSVLNLRRVSRIYQTPAFPKGSGPDYANATLSVETEAAPRTVLRILHEIEAEFGRDRQERWGQRVLDLDLLAHGDALLPDRDTLLSWMTLPLERQIRAVPDQLILPHPRLQDRAFVLVPLAEIAPDWIHPITGLTVKDMRDALPVAEKTAVTPLL